MNTHKTASLYKVFPPEEAQRLAERIEWHAWELAGHGRNRNRHPEQSSSGKTDARNRKLSEKYPCLEHQAHCESDQANWQFTIKDARIKLKKLYPETL